MARRRKSWTEEDGARLKALVAIGASALRAASLFDVSVRQIRERARKLCTPFPTLKHSRRKLAAFTSQQLGTVEDKKPGQ